MAQQTQLPASCKSKLEQLFCVFDATYKTVAECSRLDSFAIAAAICVELSAWHETTV
jgi:hypothetical protein